MAIAFVNSANGNFNVFSPTPPFVTGAFVATAGNLIVAFSRFNGSGTASVAPTDTAGNTYIRVGADLGVPGDTTKIGCFYAKNITGNAANVLTFTYTGGPNFIEVYALQYSGASTTAPLDTNVTGTVDAGTPATSVTSAAFSTSVADAVAVAGATVNAGGAGFVAGTGYTMRSSLDSTGCEDKIFTTLQTGVTASMSQASHGWAMIVAVMKAASAGGIPNQIIELNQAVNRSFTY